MQASRYLRYLTMASYLKRLRLELGVGLGLGDLELPQIPRLTDRIQIAFYEPESADAGPRHMQCRGSADVTQRNKDKEPLGEFHSNL